MIGTQAGIELESMEFHRDSKTYRVQYDQNVISPSTAVVAAVTNVSGSDPLELSPLRETIDTDALNEIVRTQRTTQGPVRISFAFEESAITVSSDGEMTVTPPEHRENVQNEQARHS